MSHLKTAIRILEAGAPKGVKLSSFITDNYTTDADFILDNTNKYTGEKPFRFAYNPKTGELVWGDQMHAILVHSQSGSPFEEFVRGVYDGNTIYLRWYSADPYADPEEIKAQSFDAWYSTKGMLEANGMPAGMEIRMGVSTQDLKDEFDGYR